MVPLPKWEPQKTVYDLYTERERTPWVWRLLGILSASMILLGFLVFPAAFETTTNTIASQGSLSIVALVLLALGYSLSVALWFICQSTLFQFDILFMPCLFSCVLGLLNTCISLAVHPTTQIQWTTSSISALSLAATSTLIYSGLALYTFRKLCNIRKKDNRHRRTDSESITLLPENELQRQQLLRLLVQKESDKKSSPNQSTYRIDIPDSLKLGRQAKSSSPFLIPPSSIPEGRRQSFVSSPLEEQFARMRGQVQEVPVDRKLQALESARERSLENRSREVSTTPPIIINTRTPQDTGDFPLSERHPLEREEFIRGTRVKNDFHAGGVYRPEDQDEEYSFDPNGQGRRMEIELEDRGRMENELEGTGTGTGTGTQNSQSEFEDRGRATRPRGEYAAALSPRIVRVQTDGWPGR